MKKLTTSSKNKTIRRIYLIIYDQQEFFGYDTNTPVKAFKTKKIADIYAQSRNFEFQTLCILDEEDFETYVLNNSHTDYIISVSDFRDAYSYIKEEMLRLEKNKIPTTIWELLENIRPFKVIPIEYVSDLK